MTTPPPGHWDARQQPPPTGPWGGQPPTGPVPGQAPGPGSPHGPPAGPHAAPQPGPAGPAPWSAGQAPGAQGFGPQGPWPGAPYGNQPPRQVTPDAVRRVLQILCPVLVLAGLTIPEGGSMAWSDYLLWSVFAFAASLAQLASLRTRAPAEQSWTIAAVATAALVGYWVIIVLPGIASNAAFVLTLGIGCAAVGTWLSPGRRV